MSVGYKYTEIVNSSSTQISRRNIVYYYKHQFGYMSYLRYTASVG